MSQTAFELLIATSNTGKIRELKQMLRLLPITLRSLNEFPDVIPVAEVGHTYEENAVLKALGYSEQTGLYALADDSGLEAVALGGIPGVFSARFGGDNISDHARTDKLLAMMSPHHDSERAARFMCCMAVAGWDVNEKPGAAKPKLLNVSEGKCEGMLALEPRGSRGFGYDPIFIPNGYEETFGQLSDEVKRRVSHRAKALSEVRTFLEQFLKQT